MTRLSRRDVIDGLALALVAVPAFASSPSHAQDFRPSPSPEASEQVRKALLLSNIGTQIVDVTKFGAVGDGASDSWPAFKRAHDTMKDGDVFYIPPGRYALSKTWQFSRFRSAIICQGFLIPHGKFDDFLVEIINLRPGGDKDFLLDLGITCMISELKLDCLYQSRGLRVAQVYNSLLNRVAVWRCRGKAIDIDHSFENVWVAPVISGGIGRGRPLPLKAWNTNTLYKSGDVVGYPAAAWAEADTYLAGSIVKHKQGYYRAIEDSRPRRDPTQVSNGWVPTPPLIFEARRTNNASDPLRTEGLAPATGFYNLDWVEVLDDEPALSIVNTSGNETVDHQYFYGLCIRHCYHVTLVDIDNKSGLRKAANIEFYGAQLHAPISEYTKQMGSVLDFSLLRPLHTVMRVGRSIRTKIVGCNLRSAQLDEVTLLRLGGDQKSRLAEEALISGSNFSGEGHGVIACHVMPSVLDRRIAFSNSTIHFADTMTCRAFVDPNGIVSSMLAHEVVAARDLTFSHSHVIRIADASGKQYVIPAKAVS